MNLNVTGTHPEFVDEKCSQLQNRRLLKAGAPLWGPWACPPWKLKKTANEFFLKNQSTMTMTSTCHEFRNLL